jgi:hypothetical protein
MKFIITIFTLLFVISLNAQGEKVVNDIDKEYLVIDGPYIKNSKGKIDKEIRKTIMTMMFKGKRFTLLLNNDLNFEKSKINVFKIKAIGERKGSLYDITLKLRDEGLGSEINTVSIVGIEERHVLFKVRSMVVKLFQDKELPEDQNPEFLQEIKDNKEKVDKEKNKKRKISGGPVLGDQIINEIEEVARQNEFEIAKAKADQKREELLAKEENKEVKKKKRPVSIANFSSPDLNLTKSIAKKKDKTSKFTAYYDFSYGLGYAREILNSKVNASIGGVATNIEVVNNLALMQGFIKGNARLEPNEKMGVTGEMRISKILGKTDYKVSSPISLDVYAFKGFEYIPITFRFGLRYETSSFANIGVASEEIQAWTSKFLWYNFGAELQIPIASNRLDVGFELGSVFNATTDHKTFGKQDTLLEGSRAGFYVRTRFWNKFSVEIKSVRISSNTLGGTSLVNEQNQTLMSFIYN